jgi:ABC-2 family transporter protein
VLKLRRPSIIYGGSGALLGFTLLATVLTITTATKTLAPPTPGRGQAATVGQLAQAGGLTLGFGNAAALIGVVMLVLFATSTTAEYGQGTVRTMLIRQPRRARLLVGKLAALLACVAGALLVTEIISMIAAVVLARTRDIPTTQWFTTAGLGNAAGDYANALFAAATFGIFGTALGVLLRSTPLVSRYRTGLAAAPGEHHEQLLERHRPLVARPAIPRHRRRRHHPGLLRTGSYPHRHLRRHRTHRRERQLRAARRHHLTAQPTPPASPPPSAPPSTPLVARQVRRRFPGPVASSA